MSFVPTVAHHSTQYGFVTLTTIAAGATPRRPSRSGARVEAGPAARNGSVALGAARTRPHAIHSSTAPPTSAIVEVTAGRSRTTADSPSASSATVAASTTAWPAVA